MQVNTTLRCSVGRKWHLRRTKGVTGTWLPFVKQCVSQMSFFWCFVTQCYKQNVNHLRWTGAAGKTLRGLVKPQLSTARFCLQSSSCFEFLAGFSCLQSSYFPFHLSVVPRVEFGFLVFISSGDSHVSRFFHALFWCTRFSPPSFSTDVQELISMYSFVSLWVPSYFNTQTFSVFGCMFGQRVGPVDPITCQNYLHLGPKPGSDELAQTVGPWWGGLDKEPFTLTDERHTNVIFSRIPGPSGTRCGGIQ